MNVDIRRLIPKCDRNYCIVSLREIGSVLGNRGLIDYLFTLTEKEKLILDFTGVEFISRGFAHELYLHMIAGRVIPINMNEDIKRMLKIIENSMGT